VPSIEWNKETWKDDLSKFKNGHFTGNFYGDHWGDPHDNEVLKRMVNTYILPYISDKKVALEIGPGGGRWTQFLKGFKKLYCVDINPYLNDYLKERFSNPDNLQFIHSSGSSMPGVKDKSIDFCFSYDALVHADEDVIDGYLSEIFRVLKDNGRAHVHVADRDKQNIRNEPSFSDMTLTTMTGLAEKRGFKVIGHDHQTLSDSVITCMIKDK